MKHCALCTNDATSEIRIEATSDVTALCQQHAETTKRELDSRLVRYQQTSIAILPPSDAERVMVLSNQLVELTEDYSAARDRLTQLHEMLSDANRQIERLTRDNQQLRQEATTRPASGSGVIIPGPQRVEGAKVEELTGVGAVPNANGPAAKSEQASETAKR
jgi:chromosome segregation ATPase